MPQLMPLNWVFSIIVIIYIFLSMNLIYSEKSVNSNLKQNNITNLNYLMWYW